MLRAAPVPRPVSHQPSAYAGPDTLERARALGLSPRTMLDDNDAHRFFAALGDQIVTGPTLTNVNDFRAVLVT